MVLTRSINDRTYFNHLTRLVHKKILNKQDYGQRGKVSVFYSLTEEAKMRIKLRLLKEIDTDAETFRKIYAHLLIRITEPQRGLCNGSYLDELLSEFNMSRKDLRIHHINKEMDPEGEDERFDDKPELKMLRDLLIIYYKPILSNLLHIGENIRYVKNIRTSHIYEIGLGFYIIVILGMSAREFLKTFGFLKPKEDKLEEAFALLLKSGLIRPIMNFRGETRYDLVDYELYYLMRSIRLIIDFDADVNKTNEDLWPPDYEEIEKRKLCFADEISLQKSPF